MFARRKPWGSFLVLLGPFTVLNLQLVIGKSVLVSVLVTEGFISYSILMS